LARYQCLRQLLLWDCGSTFELLQTVACHSLQLSVLTYLGLECGFTPFQADQVHYSCDRGLREHMAASFLAVRQLVLMGDFRVLAGALGGLQHVEALALSMTAPGLYCGLRDGAVLALVRRLPRDTRLALHRCYLSDAGLDALTRLQPPDGACWRLCRMLVDNDHELTLTQDGLNRLQAWFDRQ
jgi:hypothetical protein